jgi:hypothetical protein
LFPISKSHRKALRHWATIAYDRELGSELAKLGAAIDAWRAGERSPHAVHDEIHQFHDGVARDLYRFYTRAEPASAVAQALVAGVIAEVELPPELLPPLQPLVQFHRWQATLASPDEADRDDRSDL